MMYVKNKRNLFIYLHFERLLCTFAQNYLFVYEMKITILKIRKKREVINREELADVAAFIKKGLVAKEVRRIREVYHLMRPRRKEDGQVVTGFKPEISLPRVCFAAEYENRNKERLMVAYNGLVVLELNGIDTYEKAVALRNQASRMPETLMAFLGGFNRILVSVHYAGLR